MTATWCQNLPLTVTDTFIRVFNLLSIFNEYLVNE